MEKTKQEKPVMMVSCKSFLPEVGFEGGLGQFWPLDRVPIEALAKGFRAIYDEARRRGYREHLFLDMAKNKIWEKLEEL